VKVQGEIELDRHFPKHWPGRVRVKLSDGRSVIHEVVIPKGESGNPMTREEVEEKFLSLAGPLLGEAKASSVIGEVQALDSRDSLEPLIDSLKVSG